MGSTGGTAGEPLACDPVPAKIPLEEFSQTFAAAICAQKAACGCDGGLGCEGEFAAQFDAVVAYAAENGIPYDGQCAARVLFNTVTVRGCELRSEHGLFPCQHCPPFRGVLAEGEACHEGSPSIRMFTDPCRSPDNCDGMKCVPPLPNLGPGEPCDDGENVLGYCMAETLCDLGGSNTCEEPAPVGGDCSDHPCVPTAAFCNADALCEAARPPGEPCTAFEQCASFYCPWGQGTCEDYVLICELENIKDLLFGPYLLQ
jgi:hypothetical protein